MSLKDRLDAESPLYRPSFAVWLISLSPDDRSALEAAALNPAWSTAALVRIITDDGCAVAKERVAKWRRELAG